MPKFKTNQGYFRRAGVFTFLAILLIAVPQWSFAACGSNSIGDFGTALTNILQAITGTPAQVIATLAIIFLGISAFFGKLQWGTALLVGVGIAAIFGAASVVTAISGC